ncbi:pentapeptide repeat-containing protein [Streptomyces longwoodensis]|uniref:pentapeptide repeat-containing protein n=1 Tax=Streptomyces longwoodensis TaxID=68231 RepID=UPI0038269AA6
MLNGINTGEAVDFRGVVFTAELIRELQETITRCSAFGESLFTNCQFLGPLDFTRFGFQGPCWFDGASFDTVNFAHSQFHESACFLGATFGSTAVFSNAGIGAADLSRAKFKGPAHFNNLQRGPSLNFEDCIFSDLADFVSSRLVSATFENAQLESARFGRATFESQPTFRRTQFTGLANFEKVSFPAGANFRYAQFPKDCLFTGSVFGAGGSAVFAGAQFGNTAGFNNVTFNGEALFSAATCMGSISFKSSHFSDLLHGPLSAKYVNLGYAHFERAVRFEVTAKNLGLSRANFSAAAAFNVRFATVYLTDVHLRSPLTIASYQGQFKFNDLQLPDPEVGELSPLGKVTELAGVDAALLVLNDVDLSQCSFTGAYHLDQVTLEGECRFATPPARVQWGLSALPFRWWTRRKTLSDEVYWRSICPKKELDKKGWTMPSQGETAPPSAQNVAAIYRQLRKAFEDGANEPGAADFYYGEMEMRRRNKASSRSERGLLHAYWALSGFGLRASRAITWLLIAMTATIFLMTGWGLPSQPARQTATGIVSAPGRETTLVIEVPRYNLNLPFERRWTPNRFERSGRVVVNSVVFRSSGQGLTPIGVWIEMISRFTEPILLGLAILAIRGRIKRS